MKAELAHVMTAGSALPPAELPEVAVAGRSNVGKSSFINALLGRRQLARTSRTPGRTRQIHFYRIDARAYLVDLPGFGYAAVGREERRSWQPLVETYLRGSRETLRGALLLVDVRRGPESEELELLRWLEVEGIPARLVLAKADRVKPSQLGRLRSKISAQLELPPSSFACVSARTGRGLATVGAWMREWTGLEFRRPDGSPLLR